MDDPNELAKDIITGSISGSVGKVVDSKVAVSLLGPAATELGDLMGQIASVAHFYATDNMARIFKRWAEDRKGKAVSEDEFKRILPLLPTASLVSDSELQEKWACLLEASSSADSDLLPSFGQTLAQLTVSEVRFLDAFWIDVFVGQITKFELWNRYWSMAEPTDQANGQADLRSAAWRKFNEICFNLRRLGLLETVRVDEQGALLEDNQPNSHGLVTKTQDPTTKRAFTLTSYGGKFVLAVKRFKQDDPGT